MCVAALCCEATRLSGGADTVTARGDSAWVLTEDIHRLERDIMSEPPLDTCCRDYGACDWIGQLIRNGFQIHDPKICYPRFPAFCLKVYNWGDKTFNSYDTNYVVGTGKNWKLQAKSYNWMESAAILYPRESPINMHSEVYSDAGFSLSFMAVSVGYMWNVNKLFSEPVNRRTFNLDFNCSRFAFNFQTVSSSGGMIITRFGDYDPGHRLHHRFDDTSLSMKTFDAYWFFNNYHYSQAAAYSYSKYQLRNAGTALVGFNMTEQHMSMDFAGLPADMLAYSPTEDMTYTSDYRSYCLMGGYSYNLVLHPRRWLLNGTVMAAVGYKRQFDSEQRHPSISRFANNYRLNMALVYNHRALFASLTMRGQVFVNFTSTDITHLNSFLSLTAAVGMRF